MSKPPKEEYSVVVLSRRETTTFPKMGEAVITVGITYVGAGLPPRTLWIPKAKYTKEAEAKAIREDITLRLTRKPESFKV